MATAAGAPNLGGPVDLLSCGEFFTCAWLRDFTLKCWGSNSNGQLGDGNEANVAHPPTTLTYT